MKSILESVQAQIREYKEKRNAELQNIQSKINEAYAQVAEAEKSMEAATTTIDIDTYQSATAAKQRALIAIDMYKARLEQFKKKVLITEEESDKVIDSLLDFENELTAQYEADIIEQLLSIRKKNEEYRNLIVEVENTISDWTSSVHANYRNRSGAMYYDEFTQTRTNRSNKPISVRVGVYNGSDLSRMVLQFTESPPVKEFLRKVTGAKGEQ